jgi:hypothetical protein
LKHHHAANLPCLALVGLGLGLGLLALTGEGLPVARAAGVFSSQPVDGSRFVVLAKPVGLSDWSLLVLEQIRSRPLCWQRRGDGLVDAALNRFDFTGICSRYIDSNGYSIRAGDQDLGSTYRLRISQVGQEVQLQAMTPAQTTTVLVGRGTVSRRDRDGFVAINLEPNWQLSRRVFGRQTLNHLYFATASPMEQLIGQAGRSTVSADQPPGEGVAISRAAAVGGFRNPRGALRRAGPIALPVVPFTE